jgi:hypothetical protein
LATEIVLIFSAALAIRVFSPCMIGVLTAPSSLSAPFSSDEPTRCYALAK